MAAALPRVVALPATSSTSDFGEGYLRGVLDKSELPKAKHVKVRAGYDFEANTLDVMKQNDPVTMSLATQRQVEASRTELQLHSMQTAAGGVHFRVAPSRSTKPLQEEWADALEHVKVCCVVGERGG